MIAKPNRKCDRCNGRLGDTYYQAKGVDFTICGVCAASLKWISHNRCGQSCQGHEDRGFRSKPINCLEKGDVLPGCAHRVRTRVIRFIRSELFGHRHIFEVIPLGISKNIFETIVWGSLDSLIDVEK